ncbi:DUF1772 domain-containing protein [Glutamicibacter sp. 287]|uniref:DUF1772 domain-containing protein n=1 Tax=unclassified Glutamicibacter TaxID=2627139 RepID=UPI000BB6FDD1|nr:DUF1772 domain-containing protein [Glutamicibacter sp. BW80]PCC29191.1 hypothetical protein CIK76_07150 [Glutamicibacter sp. BW80]
MIPEWLAATLLITTISSAGIVAGFYAAFALTVLPALASVQDSAAGDFMISLNQHAERPAFLSLFFLSLFGSLGYTAYALVQGLLVPALGSALVLSGALLTIFLSVPLNRALQRATLPWARYWPRWHRVNVLRAAGSAAGSLLLLITA